MGNALSARVAFGAALAIGAAGLVGCSSSTGASSSAEESTAECTTEVLQPLVNEQADMLGRGNVMPIGDLQCADGWAVATGTLQPKGEPASFIFQGQGSEWVWQSPAEACGKTAEKSAIPDSLFAAGCAGS